MLNATEKMANRPIVVTSEEIVGNRELRDFGLVVGALIAAIFGILLPVIHRHSIPWWPWTVAAGLVAAAIIRPSLLYYFNSFWNVLGKVLGWINTRVILGLLFYVVVTPMGLLLRLFGRSTSCPNADPSTNSYRVDSREIARTSFEKPF